MHLDTRLVHGLVQTTRIDKLAQTKPESRYQMSWIDPSQKTFNLWSFSSSILALISSHIMHAFTSHTRMKSITLLDDLQQIGAMANWALGSTP